jgi:hypothetical protein
LTYLKITDIKVSLDGVDTIEYTLANAGTVQFNTAPADGVAVRIYRQTDDEALVAQFFPGSAIRAQDLNDNFTQNLYVVQEVNNNALTTDGSNPMVGDLNMGNYRVVNSGQPTADNDLATKKYVDSYAVAYPTPPSTTYWNKAATEGQLTLSGADDFGIILSYVPNREQVYVNGALQQRDIDYTPTLEDQITFTVPLKGGDVVNVIALNYLTGRDGDQGIQGIQGIQGEVGLQGLQGIQGVEGPIGLTGYVDALQDGTAALPGIRFGNDTDTGIYRPGADQVAVATNGNQRITVDSGGRLLVGTSTAPSSGSYNQFGKLIVQGNTFSASSNSVLSLNRGEGAASITSGEELGVVVFGDSAGNEFGNIQCVADAAAGSGDYPGRLAFFTTADGAGSPTEQLRITSDRYVRLASGTGGIQFNGDTAAANALDDYEEGTWTPNLTGSGGGAYTYGGRTGIYTKVGNTVTVHCAFEITGTTTPYSGNLQVDGLPYLCRDVRAVGSMVPGSAITYSAPYTFVFPQAELNSTVFYIVGGNLTSTALGGATISTGNMYGFSLTYKTS